MRKRYSNYLVSGIVSVILILVFGLNVMAAHDGKIPYTTDKSDRTILKNIITNQETTHALLNEIKALLQEEK